MPINGDVLVFKLTVLSLIRRVGLKARLKWVAQRTLAREGFSTEGNVWR